MIYEHPKNEELRKKLIHSSEVLLGGKEKPRLLEALKSKFQVLTKAYIINWTPEQFEDIYEVIVSKDCLAIVELNRIAPNEPPLIKVLSVKDYQKRNPRMLKQMRREFDMALELMCAK